MASRTATAGPIERRRRFIVGPSSTSSDKDSHIQFPDARIEDENRDGQLGTLDIEVETLHYCGAHAISKASAGFSRHSAGTARVIGARGSGAASGRRGSAAFVSLSTLTAGRVGRRQHLLFISERSRLPVVLPIREAEAFEHRVSGGGVREAGHRWRRRWGHRR